MKFINYLLYLFSYFRGLWLVRSPKFIKAIPYFEQSLKFVSKNSYAIYESKKYLGIAYCYNQEYKKAKVYLLEAEIIAINKEKFIRDSELLAHLGYVYDAEKNFGLAKEYYQSALKSYRRHDFIDSKNIKLRLKMIE